MQKAKVVPLQPVTYLNESSEQNHYDDSVVSANEYDMVLYGKNTGTSKTYTGLEPLPLSDFENADYGGGKEYSCDSISYGFGVASNEKPHEISINNQRFFDEKKFKAVCYDNKTSEKRLYLTFDCGYENGYTEKILNILKEKNVSAAFFCTLAEVEPNAALIARMIREGHIVGNHSVTHPDFSSLSRKQMFDEIKGFDDYMREHFGYSSRYFRYPQGKFNEDSLYFLNSMGYTCVFWSLAYADWDLSAQKGADYAEKTVMDRLHPGAVILLHSVSPDNAAALGKIIDGARNAGYEFYPIDKL